MGLKSGEGPVPVLHPCEKTFTVNRPDPQGLLVVCCSDEGGSHAQDDNSVQVACILIIFVTQDPLTLLTPANSLLTNQCPTAS